MDLHLALSCAALVVACATAIYVAVSLRRSARRIDAMQEMISLLSEQPTAVPDEAWRQSLL